MKYDWLLFYAGLPMYIPTYPPLSLPTFLLGVFNPRVGLSALMSCVLVIRRRLMRVAAYCTCALRVFCQLGRAKCPNSFRGARRIMYVLCK